MILRYSERLRSNVTVVQADEFPTSDEVLHHGRMHSCLRSCCGGRQKIALAFDTEIGPGREQFIQAGALQRTLRQRQQRLERRR